MWDCTLFSVAAAPACLPVHDRTRVVQGYRKIVSYLIFLWEKHTGSFFGLAGCPRDNAYTEQALCNYWILSLSLEPD